MRITDKQRIKIEEIALKYHLKLVLLFGSQAKGNAREESDVDIAISSKQRLSESDMINLNFEFTNVLSTDKVDLVNISGAPPLLLKQIADTAKVIYQKTSEDYPNFLIYSNRLYVEAKSLFKLRRERVNSAIQGIRLVPK